jgi:Kef-type K+ transport system membrane component KefB
MKNFKNSIFYIATISIFSTLIYWFITMGKYLETGKEIVEKTSNKGQWGEFLNTLSINLHHPLAILLAQIVTIVLVARFLGWVCTKIGQPSVIGEMIAGIVLGPSLLGLYFPEFSEILFPETSKENLKFLSQIGLILFMFIVGMELDLKVLKNKAHDAVVISHASIIIPFALGVGLAYFLYDAFAPSHVQFLSFALFVGIAMSITAFPVLARIVQERGIHKTKLGTIVITCAAADDITAWCLLAAVIAIAKAGSFVSSLYVIGLSIAYVILMIKVVRPFLKRIGELYSTKESLTKPIVAIFFLILIISSYATEVIGIHALFGAFMAGAIMPESAKFRHIFVEKIEDVALVLLLPLFFVYTGLNTEIGLLNDWQSWKITGIIILIAVIGKFVGSAIAARYVGQNWKDSLTIGALMNTRGLMELVVLNIGLEMEILSPKIFAMLVIMALLTTFMTGPALDLINWLFRSTSDDEASEIKETGKYRILFSFGAPESGRSLLKLATSLTRKMESNTSITAMHISSSGELSTYDSEEHERTSFAPIVDEAEKLNQKITTLYKVSVDIDGETTNIANKGEYDLLLIELGESIFEGTLLGKVLGFTTRIINPETLINTVTGKENLFDNSSLDEHTKLILLKAQIPVGILLDKKLEKTERIFIPVFDTKDAHLITYAQKLIHNSGAQVVVIDVAGQITNNTEINEKIRVIEQNTPNHIALQNQQVIEKSFLSQQDLMIISIDSWKQLVENKTSWLSDIPSTLIIAE